MILIRRGAAAVSLGLLLAVSVGAQQIPSLGETIDVAIVNLDVVVTDRDGNRVRGLTRDDFEVVENGKPQPISNFAEYRGSAATAGAGGNAAATAAQAPPEQRRTVVVFIEDFRLPDFRVNPFIASIKNFVRGTIRRGDAVTLVTFDGRASAVRVPSTDDVALVEAELDELAKGYVGPVRERIASAAFLARERAAFEAGAAAAAAAKGVQRPRGQDSNVAAADMARSYALEARLEMGRRVATINSLINGMAGIEGRKLLLLATHRLGEFTGAEYYYAVGVRDNLIPPQERDELDNKRAVRDLIANANASGVTVYPVYPTGLDHEPADPNMPNVAVPVLANEMAMLTEIAQKTGGLTSYGTTDSAKLLPRIAEDVSDYYSLAYRATTDRKDRARDVVVRTKNRDYKVRTRNQFVEKSDDSRMRDRVMAVLHDVRTPMLFRINTELGEGKKTSRKTWTRPLKVRIPINAMTMIPQDSKHQGAFSVYIVTGGKLGDVSEVTRKTQPFEIAEKDVQRAMASYFTFEFDVLVNEGTRQVAVGVLDEVSKTYGLGVIPIATEK
jgi:VWFA-related protein